MDMFCGFNEATVKYYEAIGRENTKTAHQANALLYTEGIKEPLEALYFALHAYFERLDSDLLHAKRRCVSSAYNDARFCGSAPIKEYCYVRFKLERPGGKNAPGFFFDASLDGYKYGLNIYNMDARGMEKLRSYMLDNRSFATDIIRKFNDARLLKVCGDLYKRPNYPDENDILREWLEHRRISFVQEESLNARFFKPVLLDDIRASFDSVRDVYFMIKEAVISP